MLNLAKNDLSMVESSALAKTVVALEELDLTASSLTVAQVGCVIIIIITIIIVVSIINIIVIINTRPRPAFGRLGLGGSSRGYSSGG